MTGADGGDPLVEVRNVRSIPDSEGLLQREVPAYTPWTTFTFSVREGETLGLVGESGCGKVHTRPHDRPPCSSRPRERFLRGGRDISRLGSRALRPLRREMQIVFQDPYASLTRESAFGSIIGSPLQIHGIDDKKGRRKRVQDLLQTVGLSPEHYNRFPHEFFGGPAATDRGRPGARAQARS